MPAYTTPGVYVTESPLKALVATTGGVSAAVFFGTAARGPLVPVLISDWASYETIFGEIATEYDLGYAVYHYFANGGRAAYVSRVVAAAAIPASATTVGTDAITWYPAGSGSAAADLLDATAQSAGVWGNGLDIVTTAGNVAATATSWPTFDLVVKLDGVEVERWTELTIEPNDTRYVETVINQFSSFITVSNVNADADTYDVLAEPITTDQPLASGTDGTIADGDWGTAYGGLDLITGALILNAAGQSTTAIVGPLVTKASTRGDSFVIIDGDKTDTTYSEIAATAAALTSDPYAAHYAPALEMVDPAKSGPSAIRTTAPGGIVAGIYVRTEVQRTVAKAPAGYETTVQGAYGASVQLTDTQVGALYNGDVPVNTFKVIPGAGVTINGARTMSKAAADKFVPVRRTLNYLKASLLEITAFATFESNDEALWERLDQTTVAFLGTFWRQGGLKGARSTDAFYVTCDSSNNTAGTISQGEVHVQVGVALQSPAEFVVINLSQWSGGSSASESL